MAETEEVDADVDGEPRLDCEHHRREGEPVHAEPDVEADVIADHDVIEPGVGTRAER